MRVKLLGRVVVIQTSSGALARVYHGGLEFPQHLRLRPECVLLPLRNSPFDEEKTLVILREGLAGKAKPGGSRWRGHEAGMRFYYIWTILNVKGPQRPLAQILACHARPLDPPDGGPCRGLASGRAVLGLPAAAIGASGAPCRILRCFCCLLLTLELAKSLRYLPGLLLLGHLVRCLCYLLLVNLLYQL